jgi:hypothetical protein
LAKKAKRTPAQQKELDKITTWLKNHNPTKRFRRSASETRSPRRLAGRKCWRSGAKAEQQRAAAGQDPQPRSG